MVKCEGRGEPLRGRGGVPVAAGSPGVRARSEAVGEVRSSSVAGLWPKKKYNPKRILVRCGGAGVTQERVLQAGGVDGCTAVSAG